jgi:DNA methylase
VSSRPPRSGRRPPRSGRGGGDAPVRGRQRRALSQARAGGRVERGGDPRIADALAGALAAAHRQADVAESLTHGFHTYPARMHPATARHLLDLAGGAVLDPFCGSGTTLVEARRAGRPALGGDLNPLAVAIARAKTWTAQPARRRAAWSLGREVAAGALDEVKAARRSGYEPPPVRRVGPDPAARDRAIGEWFAPHVRREVETLAALIDEASERDREAGDVLRAVLSSILYKVSRRASDTDPSRVARQIARGAAARLFERRLALLFGGLDELSRARGPLPRVVRSDARRIGEHADAGGFELVVTSPPYAGTYDYAEQHRLRMIFLGLDPRGLERGEIGARPHFGGGPGRRERAMADTRAALGAALGEMARALVVGGRAALVIGDSLAGGVAVRADRLIGEALAASPAAAALVPVAWARQERATLGRAEARAFAGAAKCEHVLLLERRS